MAPRAAARLATIGFREVFEYPGGKEDWKAAGQPVEGEDAGAVRAIDVARKDVPVCRSGETRGVARERASEAAADAAVVVDAGGVVLGLLRRDQLEGDGDLPVEKAMLEGPSTFRPSVRIAELAHYMVEHDLESSPITTADGRLVGVLFRHDARRAATSEDGRA